MAGAESLKDVTIRPWPATKSEELSQLDLLVQIEQLTTERGHLRDITEKSLQEDIDAGKDQPEDTLQPVATKNEEKKEVSKEERLKEVFRAQQEMAGHLEWAKFAANNTLDLLSLVLSVDPLKSPRGSFTPRFKAEGLEQGIPLGSFGTSKENHDQHVRKPEEIKSLQALEQRQELVAKGSRMEALDTATDEILKAAKKLEREVRRETKYWQEIVSISDKGWPIQRLRPNSRNAPFAVRYGLPEASDHFKALGLAPLQMNKDGSILLHPALALKPRTLRVRIREEEKVTGVSQLTCKSQDKDIAIQETIQLARDSLFEEELFHEMSLETRQLMAYGVEYRDAVIYVNMSGTTTQNKRRKIIIDCIPRDENSCNSDGSQDWFAQGVAEGLRLLLAHEHDMRLYRRSQLPPPLSSQKKEKHPPPLLRTLLAVLHHLDGVNSLYSYLGHVSKTMCNAGLNAELETTRETTWADLGTTLQQPSKQGLSAANRLLEMFKKPLDGKATLHLYGSAGGQPESLTISTRTMIGQPTFGTEYKLSLPSSMASDIGLFEQQKLSSVDEAKSYLDWVLSLHVAQRQLKNDFGLRVSFTNNEPRITLRDKVDKKKTPEWTIEVLLADGELKLTAVRAGSDAANEGTSKSQAWSANTEKVAMKDVIAGWVD